MDKMYVASIVLGIITAHIMAIPIILHMVSLWWLMLTIPIGAIFGITAMMYAFTKWGYSLLATNRIK